MKNSKYPDLSSIDLEGMMKCFNGADFKEMTKYYTKTKIGGCVHVGPINSSFRDLNVGISSSKQDTEL
ncbi:hypothetical protein D3C78_1063450 [compost metagenome]